MSDINKDIPLLPEIDQSKSIHFLERPEIINIISELSPDILPLLHKIIKPTVSNNPDELEVWEVQQRQKRIYRLNSASPLMSLQMQLYEECFGVNATPGVDEEYQDSLAPTPGGLISHSQSNFHDANINYHTISKLNLNGENIVNILNNQQDFSDKYMLIDAIAELLYPTQLNDFMSDHMKNHLRRSLRVNPEKQIGNFEIMNWSVRLLKMLQASPDLLEPVSMESKKILGLGERYPCSKREYWYLLWARMSRAFMNDGVYSNPTHDIVKNSIKSLLTVRVNPEFQSFFRFFSPSGYINEKS